MSTTAAPSATRGDITLQPSYFSSSLYVQPLRADISALIDVYSDRYAQSQSRPFALFKNLWTEQGWCWLHFKVFDGRARTSFISVTERLFLERMVETEPPLARTVAMFALYTFYFTQPSTSSPSLHAVRHIEVAMDLHQAVLSMPLALTYPRLLPLKPYVTYMLQALTDAQAFHVLPHSTTRPHPPSILPREILIEDGQESAVFAALATDPASSGRGRPIKKKGRPSRREKMKRAKDALVALDKYVDKHAVTMLPQSTWSEGPVAGSSTTSVSPETTHILAANPPYATHGVYTAQKNELLDLLRSHRTIVAGVGSSDIDIRRRALERANEAVLKRFKLIDELAAEKGLEVGGEGGEKTGLTRVEKAVEQLTAPLQTGQRGGVLSLLEGAGL